MKNTAVGSDAFGGAHGGVYAMLIQRVNQSFRYSYAKKGKPPQSPSEPDSQMHFLLHKRDDVKTV